MSCNVTFVRLVQIWTKNSYIEVSKQTALHPKTREKKRIECYLREKVTKINK